MNRQQFELKHSMGLFWGLPYNSVPLTVKPCFFPLPSSRGTLLSKYLLTTLCLRVGFLETLTWWWFQGNSVPKCGKRIQKLVDAKWRLTALSRSWDMKDYQQWIRYANVGVYLFMAFSFFNAKLLKIVLKNESYLYFSYKMWDISVSHLEPSCSESGD
jgi:hypothetical protein